MFRHPIVKRLAVAASAALAAGLVALGLDLYEPILTAVRPWAHSVVFAASAAMLAFLLWRGRGARRGITGRALLVLWCLPPLAMVAADLIDRGDRDAVARAEGPQARELGRHFIVGYTRRDEVAPLAARGLIAGVYITHHNIAGRTAADLKSEIADLQALRRAAGLPPLIVAADQEGGIVSHLSPQLTALPALATLADLAPDARASRAREFGEIQGRELHDLGVTMNFAPVVDLRTAAARRHVDLNSLISQRAISGDPAIVTEIAGNYIRGLNAQQVAGTIKHFPGLGRAAADTHLFSARIDAPLAELEDTDWKPFRALLGATTGAGLMVGHATVTALDPERPASLSKRVITDMIRGAWGYDGVIVTDDLVMGAVYRTGICDAAIAALNAGVDLLLIAYDGAQYDRAFPCALAALGRGEIDAAMLRASAARLGDRGAAAGD
ncbi:MAG: glycoside hydrolase family 3 N-terminal domain-containing protein [Xanthobacteraceae bacterium]|nr:glycoside hydrolase family 3 N-terminal domain-containing protein [Xanthobacteraceae bacterium]